MAKLTLRGRVFEVAEATVAVAEALDIQSKAFDDARKAQRAAAEAGDLQAAGQHAVAARSAMCAAALEALREGNDGLTAEELARYLPATPTRMVEFWNDLYRAAYLEDDEAPPGEGVSR